MRQGNRLHREVLDIPYPGGVQGQAGWGPGQSDLVIGNLAVTGGWN